jgi:two-component system, sensor histidine kinase and response regulator
MMEADMKPGNTVIKMPSPRKAGMHMNLEVALSRVGGDKQLLAELAEVFLQEYPSLLCEARDSLLHKDSTRFERAAHTLKGRVAFFSIEVIREQALALEMMGRRKDLKDAPGVLSDIELQMMEIIPELESLASEQVK